jgi:hypothetical protein
MTDFEQSALALLTRHEDRLDSLEEKLNRDRLALVYALKTAGIDLASALSFIDSRVPKLDVPAVAEPVPTTNQKLKPFIVAPVGVVGDGTPSHKDDQKEQS